MYDLHESKKIFFSYIYRFTNKLLCGCYIASELFDDFSKTDSSKGNVETVLPFNMHAATLVNVLQMDAFVAHSSIEITNHLKLNQFEMFLIFLVQNFIKVDQ